MQHHQQIVGDVITKQISHILLMTMTWALNNDNHWKNYLRLDICCSHHNYFTLPYPKVHPACRRLIDELSIDNHSETLYYRLDIGRTTGVSHVLHDPTFRPNPLPSGMAISNYSFPLNHDLAKRTCLPHELFATTGG